MVSERKNTKQSRTTWIGDRGRDEQEGEEKITGIGIGRGGWGVSMIAALGDERRRVTASLCRNARQASAFREAPAR